MNLPVPLDEDNSVSHCATNYVAKSPCMTNQAARPSICETTPHSTASKAETTGTSAITRKQKWKKGGRVSNQQSGSKELEEKEIEFLNSITKRIEKEETKTDNADVVFGNLVSSNLKQLPKRLKLSCQNKMHQVMFKYMMVAETESNTSMNPEQHLSYISLVQQASSSSVSEEQSYNKYYSL